MAFNLEKVIKRHMDENGSIDYDAVMGELDNNYVNPIVARNKPDMEDVYAQVAKDFLNDLGIENVNDMDSFEQFVQTATSGQEDWQRERQEMVDYISQLEQDFGALENEYNGIMGDQEFNNYKKQLIDAGFSEKYAEVALNNMYDLPEEQYPTFELALDHIKEQFPEWMTNNPTEVNMGAETPAVEESTVSDAEMASMRKLAGLE